jgi:hypothetical protein
MTNRIPIKKEGKMIKRYNMIVLFIVVTFITSGCVCFGVKPLARVEMDFGTSYNLAKFNQISNPEAEKTLKPVPTLDGIVAQKIMDRYHKDFEKAAPEPPSTMGSILNINVGGK